MTGVIKGSSLMFYYLLPNGSKQGVCYATDCKITLNGDFEEVTTKDGKNAKSYEYTGKYGYTLSVTGLVAVETVAGTDVINIAAFQQALLASQKVNFSFTDSANVEWDGVVLVNTSSIDSQFDAISTFSHDLTGDGEIVPNYTGNPTPPVTASVQIIDQTGTLVTTVPAPGTYSVVRFDEIYDDLTQPVGDMITDTL